MITSHIITPDLKKTEPFITGCSSIYEAINALSTDWPVVTLSCSNAAVMADTDGSRLVLQEVKQ